MEHILGTVTSVSADAIVVQTTGGEARKVKIEATTRVLRGDTPASLKDVHPGERVVIHATKHESALVAAEIKMSAPASGVGQTAKRKAEQ
jgi:precorrin-6B methylase 2